MRCYGCNVELSEFDLESYEIYDGMCEECYAIAMQTAYDDEEEAK